MRDTSSLKTTTLSLSDKANEWLQRFSREDVETARLLLDSLRLVGRDAFEYELNEVLRAEVSAIEEPVALFAVSQVRRGTSYFTSNGPLAVNLSRGVGSEGDIAHFIRDFCRESQALNHPQIDVMRLRRVRNIIVVSDSIGSGDEVSKFLHALYTHPTIKSWVSSKKIKLTAVVHSATVFGEEKVRSSGRGHWDIKFAHLSGDLTRDLPTDLALDLRRLCVKYGLRFGVPGRWQLGYNKTFTGVVFAHKCPNTTPGILWYNSEGKGHPLFNQRGSFDFPVWPSAINLSTVLTRALGQANQPSLAALEWLESLGEGSAYIIAILALTARRVKSRKQLAERLCISIIALGRFLDECTSLGWVSTSGLITDSGKQLLEAARSLGLEKPTRSWPDADDFFYLNNVGDRRQP